MYGKKIDLLLLSPDVWLLNFSGWTIKYEALQF